MAAVTEFRIPSAGRQVKSNFTTLDFRRADSALLKDLLGRGLWDKALKERGGGGRRKETG